jgi:prefoldin subunit 5
MHHVVGAGYGYAIVIRKHIGDPVDFKKRVPLDSAQEYIAALDEMFKFNEQLFFDHPNIELEVHENDKKILVSWGQLYDVEQLLEHAIVHILRHRRQIERFLSQIR